MEEIILSAGAPASQDNARVRAGEESRDGRERGEITICFPVWFEFDTILNLRNVNLPVSYYRNFVSVREPRRADCKTLRINKHDSTASAFTRIRSVSHCTLRTHVLFLFVTWATLNYVPLRHTCCHIRVIFVVIFVSLRRVLLLLLDSSKVVFYSILISRHVLFLYSWTFSNSTDVKIISHLFKKICILNVLYG